MKHILLAAAAILLAAPAYALNPQPEPPGVQGHTNAMSTHALNPQPEPPGVQSKMLPPGPCVTMHTTNTMHAQTGGMMASNSMMSSNAAAHASTKCRKAGGEQINTHAMMGTQSHGGGGGAGKTTP